jgi:hypothetical protein
MTDLNWQPIKLAPDGEVVLTKIDDENGERNVQKLRRRGNLWFTPDDKMYVYYTPTHFAALGQSSSSRGNMSDPVIASRDLERSRCAGIADDLAERWAASAAELRARNTIKPRWFGKPYVRPMAERDAKLIDQAAGGLRAVSLVIREGRVRR